MPASPESAYPAPMPEDHGSSPSGNHAPKVAPDDTSAAGSPAFERTVGGVLCPYCGAISAEPDRCTECQGRFEPLSRQATQNAMGPWQVRRSDTPFAPPCSFETLGRMVARGRVTPDSVVRGPTTRQFWQRARRVPGLATLFGLCHSCGGAVGSNDAVCGACGAALTVTHDRDRLGLRAWTPLPGEHEQPPADGQGAEPVQETDSTPRAATGAVAVARRRAARWRMIAAVLGVLALLTTVSTAVITSAWLALL